MKIRATLEVEYDLGGLSPEAIQELLRRGIESAIGDGILTGLTEATVESWTLDVTPAGDDRG